MWADWEKDAEALLGHYMLFSGHNGALGSLSFCSMPVLERWNPATGNHSRVRPRCALESAATVLQHVQTSRMTCLRLWHLHAWFCSYQSL